jgi:hypothetical protein
MTRKKRRLYIMLLCGLGLGSATALTLTAQGVDDFATVNVKDFTGLGFRRVWNPLAA